MLWQVRHRACRLNQCRAPYTSTEAIIRRIDQFRSIDEFSEYRNDATATQMQACQRTANTYYLWPRELHSPCPRRLRPRYQKHHFFAVDHWLPMTNTFMSLSIL